MSYEGYVQYLCKHGHYWTLDAYWDYFDDSRQPQCPFCGEEHVWRNPVDETNGSYYEGERIDGYVELEKIDEGQKEIKCPMCGYEQEYKPPKYKIPEE